MHCQLYRLATVAQLGLLPPVLVGKPPAVSEGTAVGWGWGTVSWSALVVGVLGAALLVAGAVACAAEPLEGASEDAGAGAGAGLVGARATMAAQPVGALLVPFGVPSESESGAGGGTNAEGAGATGAGTLEATCNRGCADGVAWRRAAEGCLAPAGSGDTKGVSGMERFAAVFTLVGAAGVDATPSGTCAGSSGSKLRQMGMAFRHVTLRTLETFENCFRRSKMGSSALRGPRCRESLTTSTVAFRTTTAEPTACKAST